MRQLLSRCRSWFDKDGQRRLLWLIVALALIRGLLYIAITPPWQSPDEEFHFAQARLLLPSAPGQTAQDWQQEMLDSLEASSFYERPPKPVEPGRYALLVRDTPPYWVYALAAFPWTQSSVVFQLYVMRLASALVLAGTVVLVYLTARELFPDDTFIPLVATSLVLFIPQHTYINASVNDGNLAEFLTSLALYFLIRATLRGYSITNLALLLASTGLALWAKQTTYFLAVVVLAALAYTLFKGRAQGWRSWTWLLLGVMLAGFVGWRIKYLRSIFLVVQRFVSVLVNDPVMLQTFGRNWLVGYRSLWASLGWYVVTDSHWWDLPALVLIGIAAAGVVLSVLRHHTYETPRARRRLALGWLALALLLAILELVFINAYLLDLVNYGGIQGRYLYVASLPFAILFAFGWRQFVPGTWQRVVALAFVVLLFLFDTAVLLTYQIPFFYPLP